MLTSETWSSGATYASISAQPRRDRPTPEEQLQLRRIGWVRIAAAVLWAATIFGAIADAADGFPRGFVVVGGVLTGTLTVWAMFLRAEWIQDARDAEIGETVGSLARGVEQISVKLDRALAAAGEELPSGVGAQIFDLGRRAGEGSTAN